MKILFINPAVSVETDEIWARSMKLNLLGGMSYTPRIAPMVLAAVTPKEYPFKYLDEDIEEIDFNKIEADLIAITAMTVQAQRAYELAGEFRKRGYPVIMGGIHASTCPEEVALHVDGVCTGEAENYWPIVLSDVKEGRLKKFYHAKDYPPVTLLPIPRLDVVDHSKYSIFPLQATRGCPYSCEFCCIKLSSGNEYRKKPIEQVLEEIREIEKYNKGFFKKRLSFMDDNLYVDREYTLQLLKALVPLNIHWMGMGTLNIAQDEEIIELIAESGCRCFQMGFESISQVNLKMSNKKTNSVEQYKIIAKKLIQYGIIPSGFFIFGFDHDDEQSFKRTTDFTIENGIVNPLFHILTPFPGTALYERMKDRIIDQTWRHYGSLKCVFQPAKLTPKELEIGSYGASYEVARLDIVKEQLKWIWSHGPWEKCPPLTLKERGVLLGLAVRMWRSKESRNFLLWAMFQSKATDVYQIIASAVFYNEVRRFKRLRDSMLQTN